MKKILILTLALILSSSIFSQTRKRVSYSSDSKNNGLVLALGGAALTVAGFLEGPGNYGTWTSNPKPGNSYNYTYSTPNFWKQTPRQIMVCVGVSLTITGLAIQSKK